MKILMFALGGAVGFVLGSRAGRERYDEIVDTVRRWVGEPADKAVPSFDGPTPPRAK
jgi:hypothetical protein